MIYIFTASYCGARIWIRHFQLSREEGLLRFQVFVNEETGIRLTVTREGGIPSAAAVSSILTRYEAGEGDFLLYLGNHAAGGGKFPKEAVLCNKIVEPFSGRSFYPDILYRHSFHEACIEDEEAAAVYQAGAYFFGPHQMSFFERTPHADNVKKSPDEWEGPLLTEGLSGISDYIYSLQEAGNARHHRRAALTEEEKEWAEKLCEDLHCSQTMRVAVMQHIRYFALSHAGYRAVIGELYAEGKLPCRDKREGKMRFEELKRKLL